VARNSQITRRKIQNECQNAAGCGSMKEISAWVLQEVETTTYKRNKRRSHVFQA
jgi:hypothetical protein